MRLGVVLTVEHIEKDIKQNVHQNSLFTCGAIPVYVKHRIYVTVIGVFVYVCSNSTETLLPISRKN